MRNAKNFKNKTTIVRLYKSLVGSVMVFQINLNKKK